MRLELAGSLIRPAPLVVQFNDNGTFDTLEYIELGYTHFQVICIGGGGGKGGGHDTLNTGTLLRSPGGSGGGGGFHRVRGLLSALPSSCAVVVGAGGAVGVGNPNTGVTTTDGGDGGASTFNANTCRASGGKGGKRAQTNSATVNPQSHGGDGGAGNRTVAGGGAAGGASGTPTATGPGTAGYAGQDGTFINNNGKGGGGGAGGVGKYGGVICVAATAGGRGSYNPGDTSVYGPGGAPTTDPGSLIPNIVAGVASGAKASPLNGLPTVFGKSSQDLAPGHPGVVIIRLTVE